MPYAHKYRITNCPGCGADLTLPDAVRIDGRGNEGSFLGNFLTSLDATGQLIPDDAGILKSGFHAGSVCRECDEALDGRQQVYLRISSSRSCCRSPHDSKCQHRDARRAVADWLR